MLSRRENKLLQLHLSFITKTKYIHNSLNGKTKLLQQETVNREKQYLAGVQLLMIFLHIKLPHLWVGLIQTSEFAVCKQLPTCPFFSCSINLQIVVATIIVQVTFAHHLEIYVSHICFFFDSIAIGREGGVAPLIALARSDAEVNILFVNLHYYLFICLLASCLCKHSMVFALSYMTSGHLFSS